jgi:hypothetical protein
MQPINKRIFTEEEIQYLKEHYATTKNKDLCEKLGIGRTLLVNTANLYGLKKIPDFQSRFVKAPKKYNDGRRNNKPSPQAIKNSQAAIARLRANQDSHAQWRKKISESQKALIKAEKRRVMFGLEQKTERKVVRAPGFKYEIRYRLRKAGYIIDRGSSVAYYDENTLRHAGKEASAKKFGIKIKEYEQTLRRV